MALIAHLVLDGPHARIEVVQHRRVHDLLYLVHCFRRKALHLWGSMHIGYIIATNPGSETCDADVGTLLLLSERQAKHTGPTATNLAD
jgi:hypothetical protein